MFAEFAATLRASLGIVSVLLAAFVPMVALILAAVVERRRRLADKPPQQEKLLRPPGHSLSLRLEAVQEATLDDILKACFFCGFAGASAATLATLLAIPGFGVWAILMALLAVAFGIPGAVMTLRAFRRLKESRNLRLGIRGEQAVAEIRHVLTNIQECAGLLRGGVVRHPARRRPQSPRLGSHRRR